MMALTVPSLQDKVDAIPGHYAVIADKAYVSEGNLVSMYSEPRSNDPDCDNFNYFASQLRMKVECAFGRASQKYDILQKPLRNHFEYCRLILLTIARLHNYSINESFGYPEKPNEGLYSAAQENADRYEGDSKRQGMMLTIKRKGLQRPVGR
jgi:hypothetical protein